jgi:hypothetical protein
MGYPYRVGEEVIIIKNTSGHAFQIGEKVTLNTVEKSDSGSYWSMSALGLGELDWWFNATECMPVDYKSNQEAKQLLETDY